MDIEAKRNTRGSPYASAPKNKKGTLGKQGILSSDQTSAFGRKTKLYLQ
jgi:hypothetical protein